MNKTKITFIFLIIFLVFFVFAKTSLAATINAVSCSRTDVQTAINSASDGDTVNVPSGSCTWASKLTITKGVNLIGAGTSQTIITSSVSNGSTIVYSPANKSLNTPFRFSGFTIDFNDASRLNESPGFFLANGDGAPQTKIRVDHNIFKNSRYPFSVQGMFGVVDNNTFDNHRIPLRHSWCGGGGYGKYIWEYYPLITYGANENNIYYEDNTFTNITDMLIDAQCGERYALRYNTVSILSDSYPIADMHGNYDYGGNTVWYSTMGGEFYGNNLNLGSHQANLFQQRGGKALWFFNNINSTGSVSGGQVSEERADSESPLVIHPERVLMQHVQDTYVWGNKKNYSTNLNWAGYSYDACTGIPCNPNCLQSDNACYNGLGQLSIQPNKQYWVYSASFNGTSGMGCGTLANRPLACTTGVAYWATDQSCDNLTGMVGANVSTPIYGTLYKCTSTDTWTFYYTPLQYPHPLRAESASDTTPPAAPTGVAVS